MSMTPLTKEKPKVKNFSKEVPKETSQEKMDPTTVLFVRGDERKHKKMMRRAYNAANSGDDMCQWITEEECMHIKEGCQTSVFVFAEFDGLAFQHIGNFGKRIYGPGAIFTCFKAGKNLPKMPHPVYNLSMKGLKVCCTNLSLDIKALVQQRIIWMCGEVSNDLSNRVTHLIAGNVGSKKYMVAASNGILIMSKDWVDKVWEDSLTKECHANCKEYLCYRCPIFIGCNITVSGFKSKDRAEIREMIQNNGGTYSSQMKQNVCTHVILRHPEGKKYEFAQKWQIPVVCRAWIFDSLDAGYSVDIKEYKIAPAKDDLPTSNKVTSTPTAYNSGLFMGPDVNQTHRAKKNCTIGLSTELRPSEPLDDLDSRNKSMDMTPVSAYTSRVKAKTTKRSSSGAQGNPGEMMDLLSQYLPGNQDETDVSALLRAVQVAEEDQEVPQGKENDEATLDPSEESALMEGALFKGMSLEDTTELSAMIEEQGDETDVSALLRAVQVAEEDQEVPQGKENDEATLDPSEESALMEGALFKGKTFAILGMSLEDTTELSAMIEEEGGQILDRKSRTVPDFGVVPLFGCEIMITVSEVVTLTYIQMCVEEHCLFPVSENVLFSPVAIKPDSKPLEPCVICVSGYSGTERDCLMYIAKTLGAQCQEYFVKQARKGFLSSTHLVVNAPYGSKYAAAQKWNLPAVEKKWLLECARTGKLVVEAQYCIDNVREPSSTTVDEGPSVTLLSLPYGAAEGQPREEISSITPGYKPACNMNAPVNQTHEPLSNMNTPVTPAHEPVGNMKKPVLEPPKHKPRVMDPPKVSSSPTGRCAPCSDKTNLTGDKEYLPKVKKRVEAIILDKQRVRELAKQATPKPLSSESAGVVSPGKFLDPNKKYLPKFDLDDLMTALGITDDYTYTDPLEEFMELFDECLAQAVKNTSEQGKIPGTPEQHTDTLERMLFPKSGPLKDIVIAVSKRLSAQQSDFNTMAADLGADYRWTFDQSCTHFIFEGTLNEADKELKQAQQLRKHIVSPCWLQVCKEQNAHVDESLFPYTYNPNLALKRKSQGSPTPTPEPPPIAMPTPLAKESNDLVKPAEEEEEEEEEILFKDSPPYILFSGLSQQERADYGALVEELGGHMIETEQYDPKSTHLIVATPKSKEKYLACVCTGKWVLHKSYLEACRQANAFVDERDHEWGSPATADILVKSKDSSMVKLAKAAFRWRQQLNNGEGAFSGWKCLLMTEENMEGRLRRLLEAGGATVLREVPDISILERDVNYAFIDATKSKLKVDINFLQSAGFHCVKPQYILSYLTEDPHPTPQSFYVPEAKATSSSGEQSRKRKVIQ